MFSAIRDADKIKSSLKVVGTKVITTEGCKVLFPVRYEHAGLARISTETSYYGCFCITTLDDKYYGVHNGLTTMTSTPDAINTITIEEEPYYELVFDAGSVLFNSTTLPKDSDLVAKVYKEFVNRGKIPFFINYRDACNIFKTDKEYGDISLSATFEAIEIPISIIARNPNNLNQYFREISNEVDLDKVYPVYVPASSVNYSASSTVTKLTGSYFSEGVVSAINNPTQQTEALDYVLRY